jgi:ubiquitin-protein ligase
MSIKSTKRIQNDIKMYHKSNINDHGIYVCFNDTNIFNDKALIIGPDETPYKNGFYFFDITFTDKYPQEPPKVLLCTLNSRTRFNPNLYTRGKVCLSILGTWSGPGWTPCLSTNEILLSIQSLLNNNPIQNEPGYEKLTIKNSAEARKYIQLLEYHNHLIASCQMIEEIPAGFECFKTLIETKFCEHFHENVQFIKEKSESELNNEVVSLRMYSLSDKLRYSKLLKKYHDIYNLLSPKYGEVANAVDTNASSSTYASNVQISNHPTNADVKIVKKFPLTLASTLNIGTIMTSENDNREYIVKEVKGKGVSVYKKWVLKK